MIEDRHGKNSYFFGAKLLIMSVVGAGSARPQMKNGDFEDHGRLNASPTRA